MQFATQLLAERSVIIYADVLRKNLPEVLAIIIVLTISLCYVFVYVFYTQRHHIIDVYSSPHIKVPVPYRLIV